jgi:hypothetical protein
MWALALQDGQLVAQHEDLHIFGTIASTAQHQQVEDEADKTVETGHAPILATSEPIRSTQRETPAQHLRTNIRQPQVRVNPRRRRRAC